jgi:Putative DNA-binding domain
MKATLAQQQTALLDVLNIATPNLVANYVDSVSASSPISYKDPASTVRGLRAYRANAQELSVKALQASYPTLHQLLGAENFGHLAHSFWQAEPPERGDLAQWGQGLAAYLAQVPQLQALLAEHAYLPDVARVEWALHVAATASDAMLDVESFQLLASHDPAQLGLILSPGCALVSSVFPVVAIVQLHDARAVDAHAAAREVISSCEPQTALIWRQGYRPMLGAVDAASSALIEASLQGESLAHAVDATLSQTPDFDFSAWLSAQVQSGLLLGATQL